MKNELQDLGRSEEHFQIAGFIARAKDYRERSAHEPKPFNEALARHYSNLDCVFKNRAIVFAATDGGEKPKKSIINGGFVTTVGGIKHGECRSPDSHGHFAYGFLHSDLEPAVMGFDGSKWFYKWGLLHCENGPAQVDRHGSKIFWRFGYKDRRSGPAVKWANGVKEYWVDGEEMSEKEFRDRHGKDIDLDLDLFGI